MYHSITLFKRLQTLVTTSLLLLMLPGCAMASSSPNTIEALALKEKAALSGPIVVTIKPLYSLVAHLCEGIETPVLLMKQAQSPHHYNMRPSERRLLANARMIVWLGPQLETYLQKVIEQQQKNSRYSGTVVSAMQAKNLKKLPLRKKYRHEHDEHSANDSTGVDHLIDPHIWLSTDNAAAISKHISEQLIKKNPHHANQIKHNLQLLLNKIEQTADYIKSRLANSKQPFIAYHDAFQYFEDENGLNYIDAINFSDESGTSLKHMRRIKTQIEDNNIRCLVYQPPKPAIIKTLTEQSSVTASGLDPLGLEVRDDKNAWFEIMQQLAVNFSHCLKTPEPH